MDRINITETPAPVDLPDIRRRRKFGQAAIEVGTPDYGMNGSTATDATDAIANILHALDAATTQRSGPDDMPVAVLARALEHFTTERDEYRRPLEAARAALLDGARLRMTIEPGHVLELRVVDEMIVSTCLSGWAEGTVEAVCRIDSDFLVRDFLNPNLEIIR